MSIVAEAVSNAVRHGGAQHVQIAVALVDERTVEVDVVDDGTGLATPAGVGLGTTQVDMSALSWDFTGGPGENRLRAELPLIPRQVDRSQLTATTNGLTGAAQ